MHEPHREYCRERQAALDSGRDESRTLTEVLAISHSTLLTQVVPEAPEELG